MPPAFAATHSWVCPLWSWLNARIMVPGATIFDSARAEDWVTTTVLYAANSWSIPIDIHAECYLANGTLESGVRVAATVGGRQRFQASLAPFRIPVADARGNYRDEGDGWFHLWATGPVTPAAVFMTIHSPREPAWIVLPVKPAEAEPPIFEADPIATTPAPAEIAENASLAYTVEWFESVRTGRPFERPPHEKSR